MLLVLTVDLTRIDRHMPRVSVLTAAHAPGAAFLAETAESILTQELPPGWDLEWIVQQDGVGSIASLLPDDARVRLDVNGAQLGAATTRNLALSRARGTLLQNLDADDLLLPGAIAHQINVFEVNDNIHWAIGQADDLMPDGSRRTFPPDLPFGRVEPGAVNAWATDHGGNWPIHCAGLMYRTASLRALGGWGGLPFDEDLALFGTLSEIASGWSDERFTWLYRQHPDQLIRSGARDRWSEQCRTYVLQRVRAVRLAGVSIATAADDLGDVITVQASRKDPDGL